MDRGNIVSTLWHLGPETTKTRTYHPYLFCSNGSLRSVNEVTFSCVRSQTLQTPKISKDKDRQLFIFFFLKRFAQAEKQALRRFLWAAQLKFDFDADKLMMNCKICENFMQSACKLCTISVPTLCKNTTHNWNFESSRHKHSEKNKNWKKINLFKSESKNKIVFTILTLYRLRKQTSRPFYELIYCSLIQGVYKTCKLIFNGS